MIRGVPRECVLCQVSQQCPHLGQHLEQPWEDSWDVLQLADTCSSSSCLLWELQPLRSLEKLPKIQCGFQRHKSPQDLGDQRGIIKRDWDMGENVVCPSVPEAKGEVEHRESRGKSWLEMLPTFQGCSGPSSPGSFPNHFSPNNLGIWSRYLLPSVPGTEEATRRQSLHPVAEGGRQEHPCAQGAGWGGTWSSPVHVRSLAHLQGEIKHQHSLWGPSLGWKPGGTGPGGLRIWDGTGVTGDSAPHHLGLRVPELSAALLHLPKPGFTPQCG